MEREPVTGWDAPNPELWVRLETAGTTLPDVRYLIAGSSGTFRGRFHVCSSAGDVHKTTSYDELVEVSPLAAVWIDGFLHAQAASLWEFLGSDDALYDAADDEDEERLRRWNAEFFRDGVAARLRPLPRRDPALSRFGAPTPWCWIGGRYRSWNGHDWEVTDPGPTLRVAPGGWFWPGSRCERDGSHLNELLPPHLEIDGLSVCPRCHEVTTVG